ncbi:MAG: FAD-binding protein [Coriobacteriales bacterium]|jgi:fumarate reductase flavoprotein subunit|nr:FAD-binding protein [Coriobacteriales bacterium]
MQGKMQKPECQSMQCEQSESAITGERKAKAKQASQFSRRDFFKVGAAGVATSAALGTSGLLAACSPKPNSDAAGATQGTSQAAAANNGKSDVFSFMNPPAPIADSEVLENISADFVIVGGGIGGLVAALSAVDENASVIVLEKAKVSRTGGSDIAAIGSSLQQELGIKLDPVAMMQRYIKHTDAYVNTALLSNWAKNSGKIVDRLLEITTPVGVGATIRLWPYPTKDWNPEDHMIEMWPTAHSFAHFNEFEDNMEVVVEPLTEYLVSKGVKFYYETPGVQLVQDDNKAVIAVIAKKSDGSYIKASATKGILLSTGDMANNPEMMKAYYSQDMIDLSATTNAYSNYMKAENRPDPDNPLNTGDGHKMALWVGGQMEENPNSAMTVGMASMPAPFLQVNGNGERFYNEDIHCVDEFFRQPGKTSYVIYDSKWQEDYDKAVCWEMWGAAPADGEKYSATADTIEELAEKIGIPAKNLKATVERRNELAAAGADIDFGLEPHRITSITKAPFFATEFSAYFSSTLSGVRVNGNSQVLDKDCLPIKGLYAAGNVVGERFNKAYSTFFPGLTNGFAVSTGWQAAKHALGTV